MYLLWVLVTISGPRTPGKEPMFMYSISSWCELFLPCIREYWIWNAIFWLRNRANWILPDLRQKKSFCLLLENAFWHFRFFSLSIPFPKKKFGKKWFNIQVRFVPHISFVSIDRVTYLCSEKYNHLANVIKIRICFNILDVSLSVSVPFCNLLIKWSILIGSIC